LRKRRYVRRHKTSNPSVFRHLRSQARAASISVARIAILDADVHAGAVRSGTYAYAGLVLVAAHFDARTRTVGTGVDVGAGAMLVAADMGTCADSAAPGLDSCAGADAVFVGLNFDSRACADLRRSGRGR
jgi:hypothetical protein